MVIAKGKLELCIERAMEGISLGKQIVILGKGSKLTSAISIAEICKRKHFELSNIELKQQNRIFRKSFNDKILSCIEIKLTNQ